MARQRKIYTQAEVNEMSEQKMQKLFEAGRIDDDMWQRWYDNQEWKKMLVAEAEAEMEAEMGTKAEISNASKETKSNIEGIDNPIKENESEEIKMERANRIAVQAVEGGYVARFYRTHKYLNEIVIGTENGEHSNALREEARVQAINQCETIGILWNPEMQGQAWERKHNTYMTDEEVSEDALTLVTPAIERLVGKCKYDMELNGIEVSAVTPNPSNLSYVEDGRYLKSGAWCCANIEVTVKCHVIGEDMEILFPMELKSGQICKPKTTIADWNLMVINEMALNGIIIPEDTKVA